LNFFQHLSIQNSTTNELYKYVVCVYQSKSGTITGRDVECGIGLYSLLERIREDCIVLEFVLGVFVRE